MSNKQNIQPFHCFLILNPNLKSFRFSKLKRLEPGEEFFRICRTETAILGSKRNLTEICEFHESSTSLYFHL